MVSREMEYEEKIPVPGTWVSTETIPEGVTNVDLLLKNGKTISGSIDRTSNTGNYVVLESDGYTWHIAEFEIIGIHWRDQ